MPLCGCTLIPTTVELTMSSMVSGAVAGAAKMSGVGKSYDHNHPRVTAKEICIDWNERVSTPDFLTVVQGELHRYNIASHVYAPGSEPTECEVTLYYSAQREWDQPMFGGDLTPYLAQAQLVLRKQGQIVARAEYDVNYSSFGKWASTQAKLRPIVEELIFGDGKPN